MLAKNYFILLFYFLSFSPLFAGDAPEENKANLNANDQVNQALQDLLIYFDETKIVEFDKKFPFPESYLRSQIEALRNDTQDSSILREFINNAHYKAKFDREFREQFKSQLELLIADQKGIIDEFLSWVYPKAFTLEHPLPSNRENLKRVISTVAIALVLSYNCATVYGQLINPLTDGTFYVALAIFIADLSNTVTYLRAKDNFHVREAAILIFATHILCHCVNALVKISKYC